MMIKPYGDRVMVQLDREVPHSEVIYTDPETHYRSNTGTVVAVGKRCQHLKKGDRVVWNIRAARQTIDSGGTLYVILKEVAALGDKVTIVGTIDVEVV